ncbi:MAG: glycine cleavage system aminomethyltransferase GcvT [Candidatus Brocadiae bacterium]|nr:glycine cleavage system aminomethyltransferase GcvT [Candidatus Brocadiia bacterium]
MESSLSFLANRLSDLDQETFRLIEMEKRRQERKLIMIASESICPQPVLEAQACVFSNIYAEGYPSLRMSQYEKENLSNHSRFMSFHRRYGDRRHYKGCDYVNFIEALAQQRAAHLFANQALNLGAQDLFVNVQALSGAAANNAVYQALVKPGDTVMGLALPHGGHLTHGSKFNRSGKLYNIVSYEIDPKTGKMNYDAIRTLAKEHKPKMIIAGASAYPWDINWQLLREIADEVKAFLFADIAHPSGLVAAGLFSNPVGYAHAVAMTTHKTLCGPRGAIIISTDEEIARKIDNAVFPGEQGGPHINTIAALAVAFKIAASQEFRNLMKRVVENAAALAEGIQKRGLEIAYNGTSTHLCLVNLRTIPNLAGYALKGDIAAHILDLCGITCNKNTIPGDITSGDSSAIRLGTTWLSQLGMGTAEMDKIAEMIVRVLSNIKTFSVETASGEHGRGKIHNDIVAQTRSDVESLLKKEYYPETPLYPHYYHPKSSFTRRSEQKGNTIVRNGIELVLDFGKEQEFQSPAALLHTCENGLLEIVGERAQSFVSQVVSGNLENLKTNQGIRTFLLDEKAKPLADVHLFSLPKTQEGFYRLWMVTPPESRESVKTWLRDLSDGFITFDESCIYNKIDGPVVVEDLFESLEGLTVLTLTGTKVSAILDKVESGLSNMPCFTLKPISLGDVKATIAKTSFAQNQCIYEIYTRQKDIRTLVESLKKLSENTLVESGYALYDRLRKEAGLCFDAISAQELLQKFPGFFDFQKPYFIGQKALMPLASIRGSKKEHDLKLYDGEPRKTCLSEEHKKLTSRALVPFAGWMMPILYTSILDEHKAVRETAGLFDVSHMGVIEFSGEGSSRFLDLVSTNYVTRMRPGQSQYSYLLDPSGKVIDDIMIYCRALDRFMVVINASNAEKDYNWLKAVLNREAIISKEYPYLECDVKPALRDLKDVQFGKDCKVDIALQGPKSLQILNELLDENTRKQAQLHKMQKATFIEIKIQGMDVIVSRSGYTGEEWGFELYLHPQDAPCLWNLLLEKGKKHGIAPTGLGARDSTRTEAGFPLYGHELAGEWDITPKEAGYGSFVKYHKPFFIGKQALLQKDESSKNTIVRFSLEETGIRAVRPGAIVLNKRGQFIGSVTSCAFVGNIQVGMAYIDKRYAQVGNKLGIFIVNPGQKAKHKIINDLQQGDSFPMHESATIISRFPMRKCLC